MKPFEQQTYYELLEVPVTAPGAEIRAAFERALETYSPDSVAVYMLVDPGQLDSLRARLTEAMEILTEPELREEYDQMIGLKQAQPNTLAAPAQALAPATPVAKPAPPAVVAPAPSTPPGAEAVASPAAPPVRLAADRAPVEPPPEERAAPAVAAVETPPAEQAPAVAALAASAGALPEPAPAAPAPEPAPSAPVAAAPTVSPQQIHAAFRSYALSYVPLLVPAPSLTGSAGLVASTDPVSAGAPVPAPEAQAPEPTAVAAAPQTAASPVASPAVASPPGEVREKAVPEVPPQPVAAEPPAPVALAAPPVEPVVPAVAAPAPVPEPAVATPTPVPAMSQHEEVSGVGAPLPLREEPRAPVAGPARPSRPERAATPPPLPPGGRRFHRPTPAPAHSRNVAVEPDKAPPAAGSSGGRNLGEAQQLAQESAIATAEAALAVVAAKAREPRPKPPEIPPNTEFNGEVLRQVREGRGLSLHQLAERTRISAKHLENVEADRYAALPATVYLRGFLMSLARELGLDPLKVSRSYLTLASGAQKK
ncbi:helix-turn-helix domain-containing protein [Stigmatella erecta]|uniref:DnaJ domain-containing protein n=1 Tax=Stigmatella erecta TaxID=83460 RepID=A0A1I0B5P9_9BACT|nr:helix-turn-helix domain-containing protein [Stigmatella erecta]SET01830.1 DnaJ domain-containing protein [Stigmatella erecta]